MTATANSTPQLQAVIDPPEPMERQHVAPLFGVCSDKFGELCALFDVIRTRMEPHTDLYKIASLGRDVAFDYENQAGCWNEQARDGGIRQ